MSDSRFHSVVLLPHSTPSPWRTDAFTDQSDTEMVVTVLGRFQQVLEDHPFILDMYPNPSRMINAVGGSQASLNGLGACLAYLQVIRTHFSSQADHFHRRWLRERQDEDCEDGAAELLLRCRGTWREWVERADALEAILLHHINALGQLHVFQDRLKRSMESDCEA